jgi:hypothetical protein
MVLDTSLNLGYSNIVTVLQTGSNQRIKLLILEAGVGCGEHAFTNQKEA